MTTAYKASDVAGHIINTCINEEHPIDNVKLQSMLFALQEEQIRRTGRPLIRDNFEAWATGPVIPDVYNTYKAAGDNNIEQIQDNCCIDQCDIKWIDPIVHRLRSMDQGDPELAYMRANISVWAKIYDSGFGKGNVIPVSMITDSVKDSENTRTLMRLIKHMCTK